MTTTTPNGYTLKETPRRITIDPLTRIEGHLRIEANVDDSNTICNAVSVGTMWRGLEVILQNRDPRDAWAFTQRICGVCTGAHALASVRAVEDALDITIPKNANLIRNIMMQALYIHDHLVHFYHLHALDWVDVVSALKADPAATSALAQSISSWPKSSPGYFKDVQTRLTQFVGSGQLGPFRNGYWGHPAYKLPPEANLMAVAHYLEALDFQREIVKIHTIFGGKNPHPHWLVGGVPCAINVHNAGANGALNIERLNWVKEIALKTRDFVKQVYVPDLLAIASFYKDWAKIGGGISSQNLMSYGEFPQGPLGYKNGNLDIPRGAILHGDLKTLHPVDLRDPTHIQEFVSHSWFKYPTPDQGLHPWDGITECEFRIGDKGKIEDDHLIRVDEADKYSYIKAPRYKGEAMEVGPLARLVIGYAAGRHDIKDLVDGALHKLNVPLEALFSTLGRTAARGLEAEWSADRMVAYIDDLFDNIRNGDVNTANTEKWQPDTWEALAKGAGAAEAPRGSLGHWVVIKDKKIANYQCVVPSTWNASPRDPAGNIGAYEASLMGTKLADPQRPLEILRTIHSFDPCLACATHLYTPEGEQIAKVDVL